MCNKYSFALKCNAQIVHGHGVTDSHEQIAAIHGLEHDSLRMYEAQPGTTWPKNLRDWNVTFDHCTGAQWEEKQSHSRAIIDHLIERFPTQESWDTYLPHFAELWPEFGQRIDETYSRIRAIAYFQRAGKHRTAVRTHVREHLRRLTRFGGKVVPVKFITAGDAAWGAARGAAWGAAGAAAKDAAWAAAWDAARGAAGAAAGDAAKDAAWAAAGAAAKAAAGAAAWGAAGAAAGAAARGAAGAAAGAAVWGAAGAAAGAAARAAAWDAAWNAGYSTVADIVDWPSPWEPLLFIWELGYWPTGVVDGVFIVFEPPMLNK